MPEELSIVPLGAGHDRKDFSCGVSALDRYLAEQATQDIRRRVSNCFVASDQAGKVAACYTFAATSFPLADLPPQDARRMPRYGVVPAGLIGRLAVDQRFRKRGLGDALLIDATQRGLQPTLPFSRSRLTQRMLMPSHSTSIWGCSASSADRCRCICRSRLLSKPSRPRRSGGRVCSPGSGNRAPDR